MFNSEMMRSSDRYIDTQTQPFIVKDKNFIPASSFRSGGKCKWDDIDISEEEKTGPIKT